MEIIVVFEVMRWYIDTMTQITEQQIKDIAPDASGDDIRLVRNILEYSQPRQAGRELIEKQRQEFRNYSGTEAVSPFIADRYNEAYQKGWSVLYHSPTGLNGSVAGKWFEDLNKPILRAAGDKSKHSNLIIGTRKNENEDHDNFLGASAMDILISNEDKLQSDKTSLKKALDSYNQNRRYAKLCCISFATNNCFTSRNGRTAVKVLCSRGISNRDAKDVVQRINNKKCGIFSVNSTLCVLILGENVAEYVAWDGNPISNHGGSSGWTLVPQTITEAVDFLADKLDNM